MSEKAMLIGARWFVGKIQDGEPIPTVAKIEEATGRRVIELTLTPASSLGTGQVCSWHVEARVSGEHA